MKRRVKKTGNRVAFDSDLSSLDDVPSIITSFASTEDTEIADIADIAMTDVITGAESDEVQEGIYEATAKSASEDLVSYEQLELFDSIEMLTKPENYEKVDSIKEHEKHEHLKRNAMDSAQTTCHKYTDLMERVAFRCDDELGEPLRSAIWSATDLQRFVKKLQDATYRLAVKADDALEVVRQFTMSVVDPCKHAASLANATYRLMLTTDDALEGFRSGVIAAVDVKEHATAIADRVYILSVKIDDRLEGFRENVMDMVGAATLVGGLLKHRIGFAAFEQMSSDRTYGVFRVDEMFERRVDRVYEALLDSQFAESIEKLAERHRRRKERAERYAVKKFHFIKKVERIIDSIINHVNEHKKHWSIAMGTALGCMMLFCVTVNAGTVYTYSYHGTELGTVKDKAAVETAVEQVKETVPEDMDVAVSVKADPNVDITYEKSVSFSAAVDSAEAVADKLSSLDELEGDGYAIKINGTVAALVDTEETANQIITQIKKNYCTIDTEEEASLLGSLASSESSEDSEVEAETSATSKIDAATVRQLILSGSVNPGSDVIATSGSGTSETVADSVIDYASIDFSSVDPAVLEGVSMDNVSFAEDITIEPVTAKVSLFEDYDEAIDLFLDENGASKLLTVCTTELEVYDEDIAYDTTYEDTDTLYEGTTKLKVAGVNGTKQIIARVTKENGAETSRSVLNETVISDPVTEVILNGTQEKPSWTATGHFIYPASGKFSSGFGARWGKKHQGIDIAGSYGSTIVAADGGTVVYAGYNSSGYGYLVKIDHGNGMQTLYGHNSKILVSVGDKVCQGQAIAKMGSTGRSTGNHCHFEIHVNGTAVNPMKYL
jgi:murein DD-endopeptidase MepM/ murein hydrolase activator NlpD